MDISLFRFYSFGIAAENKSLETNDLAVTPIELVPFIDGEITSNPTTLIDNGVDAQGKSYSVSVNTDNALTCSWAPFSSNRMTAPDIRRGERVIILRYADADKFYWKELGWDEHLRRLETIKLRMSDTSDESQMSITDDNSYSLTVSTHEKHITLKTAKANGEPFAYTVQVNTKDGIVVLADDVGNYFELNSRDTILTLENAEKSKLVLDKTHAFLETINTINIKTTTMNVEATTINTNATDIVTNTTTESTTANTISIDVNTMTTNSSNYTINSTTITLNSVVAIAGAITMAPGAGGGGVSITGDISSTGTLTNNGKDIGSTHIHPKGSSGDPNTQPPV